MQHKKDGYWKANISLLVKIFIVWFIVSFGCGILFVDQLNAFTFLGYPLGFWFAQQGSIYAFVAMIFFYAWRMEAIDREYGVEE